MDPHGRNPLCWPGLVVASDPTRPESLGKTYVFGPPSPLGYGRHVKIPQVCEMPSMDSKGQNLEKIPPLDPWRFRHRGYPHPFHPFIDGIFHYKPSSHWDFNRIFYYKPSILGTSMNGIPHILGYPPWKVPGAPSSSQTGLGTGGGLMHWKAWRDGVLEVTTHHIN